MVLAATVAVQREAGRHSADVCSLVFGLEQARHARSERCSCQNIFHRLIISQHANMLNAMLLDCMCWLEHAQPD